MDSLIKFNAQTTGRDKLFRLWQYSARMIWGVMDKYRRDKKLIKKLQELETHLSTARKLFRLGRALDTLYSATMTIHLPDPTLRVTITFSRISSALYLLCDHVLWMSKMGLYSIDRNGYDKWARLSDKFWLYSIVMNLVRDGYEINRILKRSKKTNLSQRYLYSDGKRFELMAPNAAVDKSCGYEAALLNTINWIAQHKDVSSDTLKNFCDFWLPMHSLGHVYLSPTMVGLLGTVSSVVSMVQVIDYTYRLSPS